MGLDAITLAKISALKKSGGMGYVEEKMVESLIETVINVQPQEDLGGIPCAILALITGVQIGTKMEIVWDGVSYRCAYKEETLSDESIVTGAGNFSFIGGTDTGEPFLYVSFPDDNLAIFVSQQLGEHTVSMSIASEIVHSIDPKYDPSAYVVIDTYENNMGNLSLATSLRKSFSERVGDKIREVIRNGKIPALKLRIFDNVQTADWLVFPNFARIHSAYLLTASGVGLYTVNETMELRRWSLYMTTNDNAYVSCIWEVETIASIA